MSVYLVYGTPGDPAPDGTVAVPYEIRRGDAGSYDTIERGTTAITLPDAKPGSKRGDVASAFDVAAQALVTSATERLDSFADAIAFVSAAKARWPLADNGFADLLKAADPVVVIGPLPPIIAPPVDAQAALVEGG